MPRVQNSAVAFLRHLRERDYPYVPRLLGTASVRDAAGERWILATSQNFVPHPTDLEGSFREIVRAGSVDERLIRSAHLVAEGLAELHRALATPGSDSTFGVHPLTTDDIERWSAEARDDLDALVQAGVEGVLAVRDRIAAGLAVLPHRIDATSSRAHGRLVLRRVLLVDGKPIFVGFGERVADRSSPLKDVASLVRSFDVVLRDTIAARGRDQTAGVDTAAVARDIVDRALHAFLERYAQAAESVSSVPRDPEQRAALITFFRMRGALRDVRDALTRRPASLAGAVDALRLECS
jgi:predicted trehalose synthase